MKNWGAQGTRLETKAARDSAKPAYAHGVLAMGGVQTTYGSADSTLDDTFQHSDRKQPQHGLSRLTTVVLDAAVQPPRSLQAQTKQRENGLQATAAPV